MGILPFYRDFHQWEPSFGGIKADVERVILPEFPRKNNYPESPIIMEVEHQ